MAETVTADPGAGIALAGEQLRDRGLQSLFFFCKAGLGMADLTTELHRDKVCEFMMLEALRKMLRIPRDHLKTSLGNTGKNLWRGIRWLYGLTGPRNVKDISYLIVSSTARNAQENFSHEFQERFESSETLRWWYPEIEKGDIWSEKRRQLVYRNPVTGSVDRRITFHYIGVGARVSSGHYRGITLDDLHAVEEATESAPSVDDVIRWYKHTDNLLVEPKYDFIDVIGTASSFNPPDVYMYIEANEDMAQWERLVLDVYDPDTKEPIWPERFNKEYLRYLAKKMGPEMFALTMRNNPIDMSVTEFRLDWFPRYYLAGTADARLYICTNGRKIHHDQMAHSATVDLAGWRNPRGCSNAVLCLGRTLDEFNIITHTWKKRCDPDKTIEAIIQAWETVKFSQLGVEEVALQEIATFGIMKALRKYPINVVPVKPHGTKKDLRTRAMQPDMRSGRYCIGESMIDLTDEVSRFPKGERDLLDCMAYQPQIWQVPLYIDNPEQHEAECQREYIKSLGAMGGLH